ncbi:MAG: stage V sporulation protein AA [Eubacterium sp.]|nr:stage V sporulation protein AA [Eubacterium sp.]
MSETLYIKLEQSKEVGHSVVTLGDVAELRCRNSTVVNKAACEKVLTIGDDKNRRYVVSIMQIIDQINSLFENVEVQSVGETECVVEYHNREKRNVVLESVKVALICLILFWGAGFSIMSFNNDIDIRTMFSRIVSRFPVNQKMGQIVIATGYSIGIGLGIIIFYNHFINRKLSKDPTPIEVEMRKYEKEINLTLIQEYGRMKQGKRK